MQEPLYDIFGTQRCGPTALNRPDQANLKGANSVLDLKTGSIKQTQKKCLVDVKNRLVLGPVTDNRAAVLKPNALSTPVFSKNTTCTPIGSRAQKSVGKKEPSKSDFTVPSIFVDEMCDDCEMPDIPEIGNIPYEEDNYEDLLPQSERFTDDQIHKLINFWDLTRPPLSSNSPPREQVAFDVPTPELQVPDLDIDVPNVQLPSVPIMPSFQIWQDDME